MPKTNVPEIHWKKFGDEPEEGCGNYEAVLKKGHRIIVSDLSVDVTANQPLPYRFTSQPPTLTIGSVNYQLNPGDTIIIDHHPWRKRLSRQPRVKLLTATVGYQDATIKL